MQDSQLNSEDQACRIIELDGSWKREARSLLFDAYRDCPIYQQLFASEHPGFNERLRSGLREMCRVYFDGTDPILGLLVDERLAGVAVLCSPGSKLLPSVFSWRWKMILTAGINSTERISNYHKSVATHLEGNYQIPLIGIQPGYQHHGYGSRLLDAIHQRVEADTTARGCLLDTANPDFIDFYLNKGYQVVDTLAVGDVEEKVLFRPNSVRLVN